MFEDAQTFRDICAGLQSFAIAAAVFVGGIWTAYAFKAQLSVAKARVTLERLQFEREKLRQELELKPLPSIAIDISGKQLEVQGDSRPYILITLTITNLGSRHTRLVWTESPVSVAKVNVPNQGTPALEEVSRTAIYLLDERGNSCVERSTGIRTGERKHYEVITRVDAPGVYLLTFLAEASEPVVLDPEEAIGRVQFKAMSHIVI